MGLNIAQGDHLLKSLSIEEKVSLLSAADWWRTRKIQRPGLFVPHIKMSDGPNGARGESYVSGVATACFPCATCVGATFDEDSAYRLGEELAAETVAKSANVLLAPTMNVIRSPLGGRNFETYSEDPLVLGLLGAAFVRGCQSRNVAATPKHFVANETENRRTKLTAEIDEQSLREIYLLPFQLLLRKSTPWCFMTSYNRVNGEYVSDSERLVDTVLRKEWGFRGLVVSDWLGTYSTEKSINAGMDLEMPGPTRMRGEKLLQAMKEGNVLEATIDKSVGRVLGLAERLDRFQHPGEKSETTVENPQRDKFIAQLASEGAVLLKNKNQILPLRTSSEVAVIGYHSTTPTIGGGGSAKVLAQHIVTPLAGLEKAGLSCRYHSGVPVFAVVPLPEVSMLSESGMDEKAVKLEWFNGTQIGSNKVSEQQIKTPEYMIKEAWPAELEKTYCTEMTFSLNPRTSGDHLLSIISTGVSKVYIDDTLVYYRPQEPVLKPESFYFFKAKIAHRFRFQMNAGQKYRFRVQSWAADLGVLAAVDGTVFQGSSLRFFEAIDVPQAISDAVQIAKTAETAVVFVGTTNEIESEGYDRETMDLTDDQYDLVRAIADAGVKTVVVNFSGSPVTLGPIIDKVDGFLQMWFPGQECGTSVAKLLLGEVNPSGRLPMSWPIKNEDNPAFANFPCDSNDVIRYEEGLDVGYRYYDRKSSPKVQFPFGYGLSYTDFDITEARVHERSMSLQHGGVFEISCKVENITSISGKAVVQIYLSFPDSKLITGHFRPVKELRAFSKVSLDPNASQQVEFTLDKSAFSFYNAGAQCWQVKTGTFNVQFGLSSQDIRQSVRIEVDTAFDWTGV